jgi:hypothetical protein
VEGSSLSDLPGGAVVGASLLAKGRNRRSSCGRLLLSRQQAGSHSGLLGGAVVGVSLLTIWREAAARAVDAVCPTVDQRRVKDSWLLRGPGPVVDLHIPAAHPQKSPDLPRRSGLLLVSRSATAKQRQRLVGCSLVGHGKILQTFQRFVRVLIGTDRKGIEAAAMHVEQLVPQDVTDCS